MRSHKNHGIVVAEVSMHKAAKPRSVCLLVEGDFDCRFFEARVAKSEVHIVECEGKPNLLKAMDAINNRSVHLVIGVCDNDGDSFLGQSLPSNTISTCARDIESMILRSGALEKVVTEHGSVRTVRLLESKGKSPRDSIIEAARWHGWIRICSARLGLGINFDLFKVAKYVLPIGFDYQQWERDAQQHFGQSWGAAHSTYHAEACSHDPWTITHGHDLVGILVRWLSNGYLSTRNPGRTAIESSMRLAFHDSEWRSTKLYSDIVVWSSNNRCLLLGEP